jgi:hypothetical protein
VAKGEPSYMLKSNISVDCGLTCLCNHYVELQTRLLSAVVCERVKLERMKNLTRNENQKTPVRSGTVSRHYLES